MQIYTHSSPDGRQEKFALFVPGIPVESCDGGANVHYTKDSNSVRFVEKEVSTDANPEIILSTSSSTPTTTSTTSTAPVTTQPHTHQSMSTSGQVLRLRGGSGPWEGYVEVQGSTPGWGLVCDDIHGWNILEANVAGGRIGCTGGVGRLRGKGVLMMSCIQRPSSLLSFPSLEVSQGWFVMELGGHDQLVRECTSESSVHVTCFGIVCVARDQWRGAVRASPRSGPASLVFMGAEFSWQGRPTEEDTLRITVGAVMCSGDEATLAGCRLSHNVDNCLVARDAVGVRCYLNSASHCHTEEVNFDGKCYFLVNGEDGGFTHGEAIQHCQSHGGHLLDINSQTLCAKAMSVMNRIISIGPRRSQLPMTLINTYLQTILLSIVGYGASAWAFRHKRKVIANFLRRLHITTLLIFTGAYRTMSTDSLCVALGICLLDLQIKKIGALYWLKKGDVDGWGYLDSTASLMTEMKRAEYMAKNVKRKEQEAEVEKQDEDSETETDWSPGEILGTKVPLKESRVAQLLSCDPPPTLSHTNNTQSSMRERHKRVIALTKDISQMGYKT
uniref:SRCR domain-containing protein n=1 Tax=Timema douglasi TaxID=61478 RepID=A0A7R8VM33_TIMDO|nr:unnamed protein product [Timema douglasi]